MISRPMHPLQVERMPTSDADAAGTPAQARAVLEFWFGHPDSPEHGAARPQWFTKDPQFDAAIRERFGGLVERARAGELDAWEREPESALALILVCDQFPRNLYRGDPRAFELDSRALALVQRFVERGWDRNLSPVQRTFVYLPFEHSESIADQRRAVSLFESIRDDSFGAQGYDYALRHLRVIERFGRFPHRNDALGRESTPEEIAFLREPGSSF